MLTQDPNKPSAHIEAASKHAVTYKANTGILINLSESQNLSQDLKF